MNDVKLVGVDNGKATLKKQDPSAAENPPIVPPLMLDQVRSCLQEIDDSMNIERVKARIRFEWQQVTRMIDRIIMLAFVVVTTIFATVMLNSQGAQIKLTDELMDRVKK